MPQGILKNFARSKEIPNFVDITPRPIFWPCLNDTLKTKSTRHPPGCASFFNFFCCEFPRIRYICAVAITTPATSHLSTPQNSFHHEKILPFAPPSRRCHRRFRPKCCRDLTDPAKTVGRLRRPAPTTGRHRTAKGLFEAFPKTFFELEVLFGYYPELIPANLYASSDDYTEAFRSKIPAVPVETRIDRLITLFMDGHWEADAPSDLKEELHIYADAYPLAFFRLLARHTPAEQRLFWQCYWQNPCKDPWLAAALSHYKKAAARKYPRETAVMESAYREFAGTIEGR